MAITYTPYTPPGEKDDNTFMLEETNMGGLDPQLIAAVEAESPGSVTDTDGDSYLEVSRPALERAVALVGADETTLPMATFFNDAPPQSSNDRLRDLPKELRAATKANDWISARKCFANMFGGGDKKSNPLKEAAETLKAHLKATAFHCGMGLDNNERVVELENDNGFSVRSSDQRLRFDCKLFAQLGHSDLRDIPGLTFQYISMSKKQGDSRPITARTITTTTKIYPFRYDDKGDGHMILLVSDKMGRHLIVDNDTVRYFESLDAYSEIKKAYGSKYPYFVRRDHYSKSAPAMSF